MATDLSSYNITDGWQATNITIATADNLDEVTLPNWLRRVAVTARGGIGKVTHTGTDGAAIGAAAYISVPTAVADERIIENVDPNGENGTWTIFVTNGTDNGVIEINPIRTP